MDLREEILKIRFVGDGINPTKIKVSELGAILYHYEKALKGIIASNNSGLIDEKKYYLTLEDIKHESAGYGLIGHSPKLDFHPALVELDKIVNSKTENSEINDKSFSSINKITGWLRNHNCDSELYYQNELITTISKDFTLSEKHFLISEYTTVYGEIIDVGKLDPRVEIKIDSGESLFFDVKFDDAVDLGKYLYKKIGLTGKAKISPLTYKIHSFELVEYVIINADSYENKFQRLRTWIGKDWDEIENPSEYLELA